MTHYHTINRRGMESGFYETLGHITEVVRLVNMVANADMAIKSCEQPWCEAEHVAREHEFDLDVDADIKQVENMTEAEYDAFMSRISEDD